ncbi:MAG TPA: BrnT family toxin [Xenococcaceae cyanobacterium]|nr:BrnT family toxin [Pleurocapsa sp. MO_226.B13]
MEFEWDENKRQSNLSKHGIDFVDAAKIFNRPVLERVDNRYDYEETRIVALGEVNGVVLFVVYTWRGEVRRIISARRATKRERNKYYQTIYG